jgi:RNA polymerase sigma-70 factor (ECF subfamily)
MELSDTTRALHRFSNEQRETLILVGAGGFSYEDAARICNCAVGTVKSRVARARKALITSLEGTSVLSHYCMADRTQSDATHEIMTQLDMLAPAHVSGRLSSRRNRR